MTERPDFLFRSLIKRHVENPVRIFCLPVIAGSRNSYSESFTCFGITSKASRSLFIEAHHRITSHTRVMIPLLMLRCQNPQLMTSLGTSDSVTMFNDGWNTGNQSRIIRRKNRYYAFLQFYVNCKTTFVTKCRFLCFCLTTFCYYRRFAEFFWFMYVKYVCNGSRLNYFRFLSNEINRWIVKIK